MDEKKELMYLKKTYENLKVLYHEADFIDKSLFHTLTMLLHARYRDIYHTLDDDDLFVLVRNDIEGQYYISDVITQDYVNKDKVYFTSEELDYAWYEDEDLFEMSIPSEMTLIHTEPFSDKEIERTQVKLREPRER